MEKKINYLARNFDDIRNELVALSKKYYPEMVESFNDASVGSWLLDLMAAVGDDLSYHTDRMYQETNINSANLRSTVLNLARSNGVKVPGAKVPSCEVELSCLLPVDAEYGNQPDWNYAPIVKRNTVVCSANNSFELSEDVNFGEQFNHDGFSNRKFVPNRDSSGKVVSYTVTKTAIAVGGRSKVYKKAINSSDVEPFMEIILPERDIVEVESVIFKENGDFAVDPNMSEFFIDEEVFRLSNQAINTYRFFEVDCLAEQYRLGIKSNMADYGVIRDILNPYEYVDYTRNVTKEDADTGEKVTVIEPMHRFYKAEWKALRQKFVTEYTDNNYLKLIFGSGNEYEETPSNMTNYGKYRASNIINNDMLGVLPRAGWTMYVLYRIEGGMISNVAQDTINRIAFIESVIPSMNATDERKKSSTLRSIKVTNPSVALGGKDAPSTAEMKNLIKYNIAAQDRCVTLKDYRAKVANMPGKFGAAYRSNFVEENNKIVMGCLNMNSSGKLVKEVPSTLADNLVEYLSHYKNINDYIEIKSGKIFNLGIEVDAFIDKNYNTGDVVRNIIETVRDYMAVDNHDMGEDIFVGDLEREINSLDGVINLIDLRVFSIYNGKYSSDKSPLNAKTGGEACGEKIAAFSNLSDGSDAFQIDLDAIDKVLYADYNSMYEILNPDNDIVVRAKLK